MHGPLPNEPWEFSITYIYTHIRNCKRCFIEIFKEKNTRKKKREKETKENMAEEKCNILYICKKPIILFQNQKSGTSKNKKFNEKMSSIRLRIISKVITTDTAP